MVLAKVPTTVTVAIGSRWKSFGTRTDSPLSYFEIPFDSNSTGPVTIAMNGKTKEGPAITSECVEGTQVRNAGGFAGYGSKSKVFFADVGCRCTLMLLRSRFRKTERGRPDCKNAAVL